MKEKTSSFYIGDDQWHCTSYSVASIGDFEMEPDALIPRAYQAWTEAGRGALPDAEQFHEGTFLLDAEEPFVSRVDPADELQDFQIFETGPNGLTVTPVDLKNPIQRRGLLMELLDCIETRHPVYQEIHTVLQRRSEHHWRLLLPVAGADDAIASIYIVRRPVSVDTNQPVVFATQAR